MIFIKHILTLATIVQLIACSDDAEGEGSSTLSSSTESTPIDFDDITEPSETSPSATTIKAVTELNTEATLPNSRIESTTAEAASRTAASVKSVRSALFAPLHVDYPLQSAQASQPQYAAAPSSCSCPCESQQSLPYYPVPYPAQPQSATYEDKLIEPGRDSYAHHSEYLPPASQPPREPTNYLPPQSATADYSEPAHSAPPPQPTNYLPPQSAPADYSVAENSVPPPQPPYQPTNNLPPQSVPAIYSRPAKYSVPAHSPYLSYGQPLPCPRNILISCTPSVQRVPCISSY